MGRNKSIHPGVVPAQAETHTPQRFGSIGDDDFRGVNPSEKFTPPSPRQPTADQHEVAGGLAGAVGEFVAQAPRAVRLAVEHPLE